MLQACPKHDLLAHITQIFLLSSHRRSFVTIVTIAIFLPLFDLLTVVNNTVPTDCRGSFSRHSLFELHCRSRDAKAGSPATISNFLPVGSEGRHRGRTAFAVSLTLHEESINLDRFLTATSKHDQPGSRSLNGVTIATSACPLLNAAFDRQITVAIPPCYAPPLPFRFSCFSPSPSNSFLCCRPRSSRPYRSAHSKGWIMECLVIVEVISALASRLDTVCLAVILCCH